MRQDILDYLNSQNLGSFTISNELPWDADGNALYIKNPKKIYVTVTAYNDEPFISTFDGLNITNHVKTVTLFFSTDAKQLPSSYDDLVATLIDARDIPLTDGIYRRECDVSHFYNADLLVTSLEYRFTKIK